jgi:hypothetical protein
MTTRALKLSIIALFLASASVDAQPGNSSGKPDAGASPSGSSIGNTARTSGTANYPADPNSASPSATGNKGISVEPKRNEHKNSAPANGPSTNQLPPPTSP